MSLFKALALGAWQRDRGLRIARDGAGRGIEHEPAKVLGKRDDHALALLGEMLRKLRERKARLLFDKLKLGQQFFSFHLCWLRLFDFVR